MTLADLNAGQAGHVALHKALRARLFDVRELGAVTDGSADCATAFTLRQPDLRVPLGSFGFATSMSAGQFLSMRGEGRQSSILYAKPGLVDAILRLSTGGFNIRDVMFIAKGYPAILGVTELIDGQMSRCWLTGSQTPAGAALFSGFCTNVDISGCTFEKGSHAVQLTGGNSFYLTISECVFWNITNTVIDLNGLTGGNLDNLFFEVRDVEDGNASALVLKNCANIHLSNLHFTKVLAAGKDSFAHCIHIENCDNVQMANITTEGFASGAPFEIVNSTRIQQATMSPIE